jgi:Universal stress protein family
MAEDMKTKLETNRSRLDRKTQRAPSLSKPVRNPSLVDQSISSPTLKRIVVPIDFSEASLKALKYAVPFAERFGATI